MKKLILFFTIVFFTTKVMSQSKLASGSIMPSTLLQKDISYSIYLPDGYDQEGDMEYPVVYLLNGFTGDETDWTHKATMQPIVDNLVASHKIKKMVIVMPDGDDRLYMNKEDGTYPFEDMLIKEFVPYIERTYKIKKDRTSRSISGLSMGGAGALRLALKYHTLFGACAAYSSALFTEKEVIQMDSKFFEDYFGNVIVSMKEKKGKDRITPYYKEYDVLHLVKTKNPELLKNVRIYFDCGDDDFLSIGNSLLHIELRMLQIPHEYRVRDGEHNFDFWKESLRNGLQFMDADK